MFCEVISTAACIFLSFNAVAAQEVARGWVGAARDETAASPAPLGPVSPAAGMSPPGVIPMEVQ